MGRGPIFNPLGLCIFLRFASGFATIT